MFTPPPSPLPPARTINDKDGYFDIPTRDPDTTPGPIYTHELTYSPDVLVSLERKRTISRRTRWAVLLVPLVLVLITASTRFLTHPCAFDALSPSVPHTDSDAGVLETLLDWTPHKRHPLPDPDPAPQVATTAAPSAQGSTLPATSASSAAAATTTGASATVPTIPATAPPLPTPFPQPFDDSLEANFSTTSCENFFLNMTATPAFRECRPFSLLLQSSSEFIDVSS